MKMPSNIAFKFAPFGRWDAAKAASLTFNKRSQKKPGLYAPVFISAKKRNAS